MARDNTIAPVDSRKLLVERVAGSRYISKSVRLRDLLVYLCDRVIDGGIAEIHEQEVGHRVFGRPPDYDTSSDNIVRVHASTLRKRLDQYFSLEGSGEPIVIELPKGNYAPVFRDRPVPESLRPQGLPPGALPAASLQKPRVPPDSRLWALAALSVLLGCSTLYLFFWPMLGRGTSVLSQQPAVRQFWSQVFRPGLQTDIVLDDASVGLYQELTGRNIGLSNYFDRDYLRGLDNPGFAQKLDRDAAKTIVLKRLSSYAGANLLWRLSETAAQLGGKGGVQFARDYSFHDIKSHNAILLGNSRSNPWIEPFESRLGLRWKYEGATGTYYPVDTWSRSGGADQFQAAEEHGQSRGGYAMVALLSNLGGTGSVLIISGTGGSAVGVTGDFLSDEKSISQLRSLLPAGQSGQFPSFEALLKIKSRSSMPREASIVICRETRK